MTAKLMTFSRRFQIAPRLSVKISVNAIAGLLCEWSPCEPEDVLRGVAGRRFYRAKATMYAILAKHIKGLSVEERQALLGKPPIPLGVDLDTPPETPRADHASKPSRARPRARGGKTK